jgi:hypothetical protein
MDVLEGIPDLPDMSRLKTGLARAQGLRQSLEQRRQLLATEIQGLVQEQALLEHVEVLFRSLIDAEIKDAVGAVEEIQTEALKTVFDDQDLSVSADIGTDRGKVSVTLVTTQKKDQGEPIVGEALDSFGASVTTVESLLLRVLVAIRRGLRPVFLMDESLHAFDPNYATNMGRFLTALCDRLGVDILMVTHNQTFFESASRSYRVRHHRGAAQFNLVGEEQK